jgi:hypothetical protein
MHPHCSACGAVATVEGHKHAHGVDSLVYLCNGCRERPPPWAAGVTRWEAMPPPPYPDGPSRSDDINDDIVEGMGGASVVQRGGAATPLTAEEEQAIRRSVFGMHTVPRWTKALLGALDAERAAHATLLGQWEVAADEAKRDRDEWKARATAAEAAVHAEHHRSRQTRSDVREWKARAEALSADVLAVVHEWDTDDRPVIGSTTDRLERLRKAATLPPLGGAR